MKLLILLNETPASGKLPMRREENVTRTRWGETAGSPGGAGTYLERCLLAMIAVVAMSGLLRGAHAYTEDEGQRLMARAAPV